MINIPEVNLGANYIETSIALLPKFRLIYSVSAECYFADDPARYANGRPFFVMNTDMGDMIENENFRGKWTNRYTSVQRTRLSPFAYLCETKYKFEFEDDAIAMKMAADVGNCTIVFPA